MAGVPWTTYGLLVGLGSAAFGGGLFLLQHALIRTILWWQHCAPLRYVQFLDYATERIFLRRAGSSYVFVHQILMEHFATYHQALSRTTLPVWLRHPALPAATIVVLLCLGTLLVARVSPHADIQVLSTAIVRHDLDAFRKELARGYDAQAANAKEGLRHLTFLTHTAAGAGETEMLALLLQTGVRLDLHDEDGMTALSWAVLMKQARAVEFLLSRGAAVNTIARLGKSKITPLGIACLEGDAYIATRLLRAGASPNAVDEGIAPLDVAVERGDNVIVRLLLDAGGLVNVPMVMHVSRTGRQTLAAILIEHVRSAAAAHDKRAQRILATVYEHALGVARDEGQALYWLRQAAISGGAEDQNALAWRLATLPDNTHRNGPEAIRVATRACEATSFTEENLVDTLAAAYAETGQWNKAVSTEQQAIDLLKRKPQTAENERTLGEFVARKHQFRQHRSYREQP